MVYVQWYFLVFLARFALVLLPFEVTETDCFIHLKKNYFTFLLFQTSLSAVLINLQMTLVGGKWRHVFCGQVGKCL